MAEFDGTLWETQRRASLRTFLVFLYAVDEPVIVVAHFWSNECAAGHWNFYTIEPSGRKTIRDSFSVSDVIRLTEISDADNDEAMMDFLAPAPKDPPEANVKKYDVH